MKTPRAKIGPGHIVQGTMARQPPVPVSAGGERVKVAPTLVARVRLVEAT